MADSKKYDGSQWEHSLRKLTTATADIEPTIYTDSTAITAYTIKGNTVQSGTPTPSAPISVNGVGDKTANLYDYTKVAIGKYIDSNGVEQTSGSTGHQILNHSDYVPVTAGTTYVFKIQKEVGYSALSNAFCWFDSSKQLLYRDVRGEIASSEPYIEMTYTAPTNAAYLIINFRDTYYDTGMLNTGSTAQSYEPYGYKIPISSGGTTTPVYLSEPLMKIGDSVDSLASSGTVTYNIKKVEFKGTETTWQRSSSYSGGFYMSWNNATLGGINYGEIVCSHATFTSSIQGYVYGTCYSDGSLNIRIMPEGSTLDEWKAYLAQEYANGTPVTTYFVRATPTTESVTAPSIPTADGANGITVDTTVQPSEFSATWTGWHDSSVKEWDGSQWQ